jgi:uncharacterized membrane-anchored protein
MTDKPTVTYFAVSVLSSRTLWVAVGTVLVGILALPDVVAVIPLRYLPIVTAIIGAINFGLRLVTVRPVVFAAPGTLTPVQLPKLDPPAPLVSD